MQHGFPNVNIVWAKWDNNLNFKLKTYGNMALQYLLSLQFLERNILPQTTLQAISKQGRCISSVQSLRPTALMLTWLTREDQISVVKLIYRGPEISLSMWL